MKSNVYSIFDTKAQAYGPLFTRGRDEEAVRLVEDMLSDSSSLVARHPDDYKLFRLGTFDAFAGKLVGDNAPVFVANCVDLVKVKE